MEGKANKAPVHEEFEPFCKWDRNEDGDILEIHLEEFKKDQLRLQLSNRGILKIYGERSFDGSTSKFYKEVPVPINIYDTSAIHAKFNNRCLYITMPKRKTLIPQISQKISSEEQKIDRPSKLGDHFKASPLKDVNGGAKEQTQCEFPRRERRGSRFAKVALKLVATAAAVAVMVAYVVYMYKSTVHEVDD